MSTILLPLTAIVFFAGVVGGTTGLGFSMISAIAMSVLISPKDAVVLLSITVPVLTLAQVGYHRAFARTDIRLGWLVVPAVVGVVLGVGLFSVLPEHLIGVLLGVLILLFVTLRFLDVKWQIAPDQQRVAGPVAGFVGGVLSGTSGVSGPIFASYLLSVGTSPRTFAFTISLIYLILTSIRLAGLTITGNVSLPLLTDGMVLLVPGMVGQWIGFAIQRKSTSLWLERVVLLVLLVTALRVLAESLLG